MERNQTTQEQSIDESVRLFYTLFASNRSRSALRSVRFSSAVFNAARARSISRIRFSRKSAKRLLTSRTTSLCFTDNHSGGSRDSAVYSACMERAKADNSIISSTSPFSQSKFFSLSSICCHLLSRQYFVQSQ